MRGSIAVVRLWIKRKMKLASCASITVRESDCVFILWSWYFVLAMCVRVCAVCFGHKLRLSEHVQAKDTQQLPPSFLELFLKTLSMPYKPEVFFLFFRIKSSCLFFPAFKSYYEDFFCFAIKSKHCAF